MSKTRQLSLLLITSLAWLGVTASTDAATFDLSTEFPTGSNPGGAWTLGWKTNVTEAIVPFAFSRTVPGDTGMFFVWSRFSNEGSTVQKNISSFTATTGSGQGMYPAGSVAIFAGNNGAVDNFGVVRFTAPSNGVYAINCAVASAFNGPISGDTDFHVIKGASELFSAQVPASSTTVTNGSGYTNSLTLNAGDTLDFAVGRGLDNSISGSGLKINLTITSSPLVISTNVFDLATDYSTNANPSGAWTFGWKTNLTDSIIPDTNTFTSTLGAGTFSYWTRLPGNLSGLHKNISAQTGTSDFGQGVYPPGTVTFFPGLNGQVDNFGAIRFTAPSNGLYSVKCAVVSYLNGLSSSDADFHVVRGATELLGAQVPANSTTVTNGSGYTNTLSLAAGESLDFLVGRGLDGQFAGSGLKIALTIDGTSFGIPVITNGPASQVVKLGSNAVFSVGVSSSQALFYQWLFNGSAIPNATNAILSFVAANTNLSGQYRVTVTNISGSAISSIATLFVREPLIFSSGNPPTISNGQFQFRILNVFGVGQVVVETSTNLTNWTPISTNTPVGDHLDITDAILSTSPNRFYRVKEQ